MIYISQGNIPSKWAHTFQAMKMAEAFSRIERDFRLVTQVHWRQRLRRRFDYESWYGIRHRFRITRLVRRSHLPREAVFDFVWHEQFDIAAAAYAERKQPCLVYTRSPRAAVLCGRRGMHTILETHLGRESPMFSYVLDAQATGRCRGLVTISEPLRSLYVQAGIPAGNILVWPDAVDLKAFQIEEDRAAMRRRLGLPPDATIAAYCGHLYEHRGVEEILEAARTMPHVHFLLVGGWEADVDRRRAEAKGLNNVTLPGFVNGQDIPRYLACSDMVLMPYSSRCRTAMWMSPLKMFEYMAARRPIVATDLRPVREYLEDGVSAVLVQPDSAPDLVMGIQRLIDDASLGEELTLNAYDRVRAFTWDQRATAVLNRFGP